MHMGMNRLGDAAADRAGAEIMKYPLGKCVLYDKTGAENYVK